MEARFVSRDETRRDAHVVHDGSGTKVVIWSGPIYPGPCEIHAGPERDGVSYATRVLPLAGPHHAMWLATGAWERPKDMPLDEFVFYYDVSAHAARCLGFADFVLIDVLDRIRRLVRERGTVWIPEKEYTQAFDATDHASLVALRAAKQIIIKERHLALRWMAKHAPDVKSNAALDNPRTRRPPLRRLELDPAYYLPVAPVVMGKGERLQDPIDDGARVVLLATKLKRGAVVGICGLDLFKPALMPLLGNQRSLICVEDCPPFRRGDTTTTEGPLGVKGTTVHKAHLRFRDISFPSHEDLVSLPPGTYTDLFLLDSSPHHKRLWADCLSVSRRVVALDRCTSRPPASGGS